MVAASVIPSSGRLPGVYLEQEARRPTPALETGVPAFVGVIDARFTTVAPFAGGGVAPVDYATWSMLEASAGAGWARGCLGFAVRGFFENGGRRCYVAPTPAADDTGLLMALTSLDPLNDFDLLCAPDWASAAQASAELTAFCEA